ncbi:transporter [Haliscomenobacter sp.]|uniref:transporter n=1 Tax=Haliscomenobacter sp. TaxID=2717303 RepID=UPI003BAA8739
MKKYYLLGLMLLSSVAWLKAQDTTSIIASDRPMFGEAVSIVPHKSLQVETGFWYSEENTRVASTRGLGLNSTLLRYGIGEKVELRFDYTLWQNRVRHSEDPVSAEVVQTGFLPIRFGMKANLIENKSWIPAVTFVGMLGLPQIATDVFQPAYLSPDLQLSFANRVNNWLTISYNLGARWDGDNPNPSNYYALATKFNFSSKVGAYLQGHGTFQRTSLPAGESTIAQSTFGEAGLMFNPKPNIQIDISGGVRVSEYDTKWIFYNAERNYYFATVGLSWRFPR